MALSKDPFAPQKQWLPLVRVKVMVMVRVRVRVRAWVRVRVRVRVRCPFSAARLYKG